MQDNKDQRTDKELEVESYLSQFDSEDVTKDDDDITSFLLDDPDKIEEENSSKKADIDFANLEDSNSAKSGEQFESALNDEFENIGNDYETGANLNSDDAKAGAALIDAMFSAEKGDSNSEEHSTVSEVSVSSNESEIPSNNTAMDDVIAEQSPQSNGEEDVISNNSLLENTESEKAESLESISDIKEEASASPEDNTPDNEASEPMEKKSFFDRFRRKKNAEAPSFADAIVNSEEASMEESSDAICVLETTGAASLAESLNDALNGSENESAAVSKADDNVVNDAIVSEAEELPYSDKNNTDESSKEITFGLDGKSLEKKSSSEANDTDSENSDFKESSDEEPITTSAKTGLEDSTKTSGAIAAAEVADNAEVSAKQKLFGRGKNKVDAETKAQEKKLNKKRRRRIRSFLSFFVPNPNYDPLQGEYIVKNGKQKKNKEKKFSFFHFFRDCVLLGCLCVLIFISYAFVVITKAPKIDPTNIYDNVQQSSVIYNDNGKAVDSAYYSQDRQIAKYKDMPKNLINAFVALEDKTFWKHHGFNWTRMIGAVLQSITGSGKISGTSTITQQLARNVYLTDTMSVRSIKRKILEMYYAAIIERKLTKEEIIEAYLNTIYLGFGTYGVETASQAYFGKSVSDLSLEQCAALAALPQAPDTYALVQKLGSSETPDANDTVIKKKGSTRYVANDESKSRRETCLALMKNQGYITEDQYNKAVKKKLTSFLNPKLSNSSSVYSYFREYLLDEVIEDLMDKYDYSKSKATDLVYTGGLKIYSTVDSKAQKVIVKEFKNDSNFPSIASYNTNSDGNIINDSGSIMLYKYSNFFNSKKEFKLSKNECTVNEDGSLTIKSGHRLNIYETSSGYSLEFKPTYTTKNGKLYMYSGGYINIPSNYESMDDNDNLVISADFFKKYPNWIKLGKNTATITEDAYTLPEKTIQPQAAMVIVEVGTGKVKAMVGGRKQTGENLYNRALNPRQSGSSIKPISVYSGAIQKSYELAKEGKKFSYKNTGHDSQGTKYYGDYLTASSVIVDERMTFNGESWPQNSTNSYSGAVTMRKALQQSINVCAVKLELQLGAEYCADLVEKFGITTLVRDGDTNDLNPAALALGGLTNGVIPLEMAQAYATFPNGGVRQSSIAYTKVTDRNGKVLLESKSESTKVLDEGVAFIMTDMLKSVVSQGIGSPASISGVQSGGKTGTTSSEYDIWFDGFTPSYAASLWIGNDVNMQLTSMSGPAASLWGKIMNQIPKAKSGHYKSKPSNVTYVSGEYYTKGTESGRSTYYSELAAKRKAAAAAKKKAAAAKKKAASESSSSDSSKSSSGSGSKKSSN